MKKIKLTTDLFGEIILNYNHNEIQNILDDKNKHIQVDVKIEYGIVSGSITSTNKDLGRENNIFILEKDKINSALKELNFFDDKYKKAFNVCIRNDKLKPACNLPFINDNKLYATDSFIIMSMDLDDITFELKENKYVTPKANIIYDMFIDKTDELSFNIKDLFENNKKTFQLDDAYSKSTGECAECDGNGTVEYEYEYKDGSTHERQEDCPACNGTGYENSSFALGYKEISNQNYISIFSGHLRTTYFLRMFKIAKILNSFDIKVIYNNANPHQFLFKFDKVEVILMGHIVDKYNDNPIIKIK